jgi:hypothetical protein
VKFDAGNGRWRDAASPIENFRKTLKPLRPFLSRQSNPSSLAYRPGFELDKRSAIRA